MAFPEPFPGTSDAGSRRIALRFSSHFLSHGGVGQVVGCDFRCGAQFASDQVGIEPSAKKRAVEGRGLPLIERTAHGAQPALDDLANQCSLVGLGECLRKRRFDVLVGHAARAKLSRNPVAALTAQPCARAREFERVASVIDIFVLLQARKDTPRRFGIFRMPFEVRAHLERRVSAAR